MQVKKELTFLFIIVSLLVHLIFLILYFFWNKAEISPSKKQIKEPSYISSYSYVTPPAGSVAPPKKMANDNPVENNNIQHNNSKQIVEKNAETDVVTLQPKKSFIASSFSFLKNDQLKKMNVEKEEEPIYLIGDINTPPSLLIKLLARSLSKHFHYPEHAARFGIRGKTLIRFTLHPNGTISDVEMVQTSNTQELDTAALYATNTAPKVDGIDRFLREPKTFLVGFVFR